MLNSCGVCTSRVGGRAIFFAFLFLRHITVVVARTPAGVQFHVQLALLARLLIVLALLVSVQRVPLCAVFGWCDSVNVGGGCFFLV